MPAQITWLRALGLMLARLRGPHFSVLIALTIVVAAVFTLPLMKSGAVHWNLPAAPGLPPGALRAGVDLPVFCLAPSSARQTATGDAGTTGLAVRCGVARSDGMSPAGQATLSFTRYGALSTRDDLVPMLANADAMLLWALAGPARQILIRQSAIELLHETNISLQGLSESAIWRRNYRDDTQAYIARVSARAWNAPETRRAYDAFSAAAMTSIKTNAGPDLEPLLSAYLVAMMWEMARDNTLNVFGLVSGGQIDTTAVGRALNKALRDPKLQPIVGRIGGRVLQLPETEWLAERFAASFVVAAQEDQTGMELLTRVLLDQRLGAELDHMRGAAGVFLRQMAQQLWGLGGAEDLNALAGLTLKSALLGTRQYLVLLLDAEQAVALQQAHRGYLFPLFPERGAR